LLGTGLDAETAQGDTAFASVPDQLGAYTIEHHADGTVWELGHGAMGVTYRAIDKALDRPVALKIINTDRGSHSAEARERFMREARAAAALRHPNVAMVWPARGPAQPMKTRRAIGLSFILAKEPQAQPPLYLAQAPVQSSTPGRAFVERIRFTPPRCGSMMTTL
jgi:hypothetical protein